MRAPINPRRGESDEDFEKRVLEHLRGQVVAKSSFGYCRRCRREHGRSVRRELFPITFRCSGTQWQRACRSCLDEIEAELGARA